MADNGNFFENITAAISELFGAKEEITNQVEGLKQDVQDANPLDTLNGDSPPNESNEKK